MVSVSREVLVPGALGVQIAFLQDLKECPVDTVSGILCRLNQFGIALETNWGHQRRKCIAEPVIDMLHIRSPQPLIVSGDVKCP